MAGIHGHRRADRVVRPLTDAGAEPESGDQARSRLQQALAEEAICVLTRTDVAKIVFREEVQWLRKRADLWSSQRWRVGVLGITSSGKSTLLNALFQERLLPARVGPTSNCLVICRKGPILGARVYYFNAEPEDVTGCKAISARLRELTDEDQNPGNERQVNEIVLYSPEFPLPDDVVLVDTPGLDAKEFDAHEKLTVEVFLPTVDAVIFVTTTKPNSDAQVKEYLDLAGSGGKPVVLVQNMVDAVVEKRGEYGVIKKTRKQVAEDHARRLRGLAANCASPLAQKAPVVQVSARMALEGERSTSGVTEMCRLLQRHLHTLEPQRETGRRRQLRSHLELIVEAQRAALEDDDEAERLRAEKAVLATLLRRVNAAKNAFEGSLMQVRKDAPREAREFRARTDGLTAGATKRARDLADDVGEWTQEVPSRLSQSLVELTEAAWKFRKDLNLTDEDFRQPRINAPSASVQVRTDQHSYSVPTSGGWNRFKRWVGWGGYTEKTKTVVDVAETRKSIEQGLDAELGFVDARVPELLEFARHHLKPVRDELHRRRKSLRSQGETTLDASTRKSVIQGLDRVLSQLGADRAAEVDAAEPMMAPMVVSEEQTVSITVPGWTRSLLCLADRVVREQHRSLRDICIERARRVLDGRAARGLSLRVGCWAWDADALETFLRRFWWDALDGAAEHLAFPFSATPAGSFRYLSAACDPWKRRKTKSRAGAPPEIAAADVLFLLLDLDQPGATESQVKRSLIRSILGRGRPLVVVAQSLAALRKSLELGDAAKELRDLLVRRKLNPVAVIANDPCVGLSDLLDRLVLHGEELVTQGDETEWISRMRIQAWNDDEAKRMAHEALRSWQEFRYGVGS